MLFSYIFGIVTIILFDKNAIVNMEMVLNVTLLEATANGEGCTQTARVAAWKALSDHTGGFDANKQKVQHELPEGVVFNMSFGGKDK